MSDQRAGDDVAAEVAFRFQHDWKPEYEKVVRTTLAVVRDKAQADHAEWVRRNFLGSASSISEADPSMQTWNAPAETQVEDLMEKLYQSVLAAREARDAQE